MIAIDIFMGITKGIVNLEGLEIIKERSKEGSLVELFFEHHVP